MLRKNGLALQSPMKTISVHIGPLPIGDPPFRFNGDRGLTPGCCSRIRRERSATAREALYFSPHETSDCGNKKRHAPPCSVPVVVVVERFS